MAHELVDLIFVSPYCRIRYLEENGIAKCQAASAYLKKLAAIGVLKEIPIGREKLFIHPKLMQLLSQDSNEFDPYPELTPLQTK